MDQRLQFVTDALSDRFTMTELCERYGVSRRIVERGKLDRYLLTRVCGRLTPQRQRSLGRAIADV